MQIYFVPYVQGVPLILTTTACSITFFISIKFQAELIFKLNNIFW